MAVRLVVFDMDGTLIDTMPALADTAARLMAGPYGVSFEAARVQYLQTSGLPFREQLETIFPGSKHNDEVAAAFEQWKLTFHADGHPLRPGADRMLRQLRQRRVKTAVASNNTQNNVERIARNWPIDAALGLRDSGFHKGEPQFRWLERHFDVLRHEMAFVGDSKNDAAIARRCGIAFVGLIGFCLQDEMLAANPAAVCLTDIRVLPERLVDISRQQGRERLPVG